MLLAVLLSVAFTLFARQLPRQGRQRVNVIYRKAALAALLFVPAMVYLLDIRLPVAVEEVTRVSTRIPAIVTWLVLAVWAAGVVYKGTALWRKLTATLAVTASPVEDDKLAKRLEHWQNRLDFIVCQWKPGKIQRGSDGRFRSGGRTRSSCVTRPCSPSTCGS